MYAVDGYSFWPTMTHEQYLFVYFFNNLDFNMDNKSVAITTSHTNYIKQGQRPCYLQWR